MPIYVYNCKACSEQSEFLQGLTEGHKRKCPSCKKFKLRRLPSPGITAVFKGSGFYETDYKRKE